MRLELLRNTLRKQFCLHDSGVQDVTNFFTSNAVLQLKWVCGCGEMNAITQLYCTKCSSVFIKGSVK